MRRKGINEYEFLIEVYKALNHKVPYSLNHVCRLTNRKYGPTKRALETLIELDAVTMANGKYLKVKKSEG